jgi:hypothetical protein
MNEAEAVAQLKVGNIAALRTLIELYQVQAVQEGVQCNATAGPLLISNLSRHG